jgi:DNA-binding HxlR family transcriptional regulator
VRQCENREYELTQLGHELGQAIEPLDKWAQRWARELPLSPS